ncbi:hypothetical protein LCER1_G005041 [Lachnellula cervina]|uniref:Hypervirulence associated protein TUDOR domain-containing protein n=1 Tax=Lachnellula cervina TaxID=1316786 RepID=A0A7D8YYB4_9HELO|nr:hypothetical protein LCER1_G005041 [Lachnellula cervina]
MSTQIQEGDKVSWNWNGSHPSGTASEVKPGEVTVTSHRGNDISKTGDGSNPAVHISRPGNDVVKTANELKVESKGGSNRDGTEESTSNGNGTPAKQEEKKEPEEAHTGEKRTVDEKPSADDNVEEKHEDADAKKQKTGSGAKTNGTNGEKKKAGRPKNSGGPKKEKKAPTVGRAQRQTRSQGAASAEQV